MPTVSLSCLCGQVRLQAPRPEFINACNCTLCSKTGAYWATLPPPEVTVTGETAAYSRNDKADPAARVNFCPTCGATTHFTLTDSAVAKFGNVLMGVNMRLADESDLAGVERRFPDGRNWSGEGEFAYLRAPEVIGADG